MLLSIFINNTDPKKIVLKFSNVKREIHHQNVPQDSIKVLRSEIGEV